jgi:hypothetical protein
MSTQPTTNNPFRNGSPNSQRDDWEDWEDEGAAETTSGHNDMLIDLLDDTSETPSSAAPTQNNLRHSQQRYSVQKPMFRAKSKGHQKAKIVKAGIKLDTDLSNFRQPAKPQQVRLMDTNAREETTGKFVDAAALKALEGSPNSASVGSFAWLRRKNGNARGKSVKKSARGPDSDLSPEARPIVIGISVLSDDLQEHQVSPQTAILETPLAMRNYIQRPTAQKSNNSALTPDQQRSVWSPDTEASESPYNHRPASSVYSAHSMYGGAPGGSNIPPVPALPATFKFKQQQPTALAEPDDDDVGTPCTLFEEDGSPQATRKSFKARINTTSPLSAGSKVNGWWDHITTPFTQQTNPFKQSPPQQTGSSSSTAPKEWWQGVDEKNQPMSRASGLTIVTPATLSQQNIAQSSQTSYSNASSSQNAPANHSESHSEKAKILLDENRAPSDEPPPYSPPQSLNQVKYGAILPPSHFVSREPIPSPGPVSPGLPGTMTSQGTINIHMAEIPLTPRPLPGAVLPERAVGTYVPQEHFHEVPGTRHRAERQRRRHEKEEVVARKVGGFWRGRGCMPENGCFGRTGREGRQRRRVCLGILGGIIAAIILIVVLAVVLTRKSISHVQEQEHSIWLNLTDFPPMPTGVLTVAGPDNSVSVTGCTSPQTLWSCSIPKDQQNPKSLYNADQPEFIFQIQYDNNTRALWNVSDGGEQPAVHNKAALSRRAATSAVARAADFIRRAVVFDAGFSPTPAPPSNQEIFFLGNTTDGIISQNKAGEPTPFYISMLPSINATVGPDMVTRRGVGNGIDSAPTNGSSTWNLTDILPPPELNADGTGAPARLLPLPSQQPVRLFDRGLPTEHYGFYTYFDKSIYVMDINGSQPNKLDQDGGSPEKDAKFVVTFSQTRFLVQIWTRGENTTQLLGNGTTPGTDGISVDTLPGTMPYPVTVTVDVHGGNRNDKATWYYGVDENQRVVTADTQLIVVDRGFGGTLVNDANDADLSLGGIDGGTGGCKCEWVNYKPLK